MSLQLLLDLVKGSSAVMVLQSNCVFSFSLEVNQISLLNIFFFLFIPIFPILNKSNKSEQRTLFDLYIFVCSPGNKL